MPNLTPMRGAFGLPSIDILLTFFARSPSMEEGVEEHGASSSSPAASSPQSTSICCTLPSFCCLASPSAFAPTPAGLIANVRTSAKRN
eukprot:CAMPEP_0114140170 /NCGR_PEP_ID=MMETSP0043_2-20121206/17237_1 /TAXON_ID=464988 /ORGANISM="Hemiselmis andersenii, Strain CCMP644" /LENGTH=87 /DNA_ID=CAMNT_0001234237 /DNA_START=244 /DNA_END=507 /DNA_ORIENTATION=-